jgi:ankyrin repeat protein
LIGKGANINHQDGIGCTGLHFCGLEQCFEVAKLLLENQGNPNIKDKHGNLPLWTALMNAKENFELVKF